MRTIQPPLVCPVCFDALMHARTAADVIGHIERVHGYTKPGAIQLVTKGRIDSVPAPRPAKQGRF